MTDGNGLIGRYKILMAFVVVKAMKDSVGYDLQLHKGCSYHTICGQKMTIDQVKQKAAEWLRHSEQCAVYLECLDWPWSGAELAEMAENGEMNWKMTQHGLSRLLLKES